MKSFLHLFAALCLGIPLNVGYANGSECETSVSDATWQFKDGVDEEFGGVADPEACLQICKESLDCKGYTWTSTGVKSYCYIFKKLDNLHSCEGCFSGTVPSCSSDACIGNVGDILAQYVADSDHECEGFCEMTEGCSAFTYYKGSLICFLYSQCTAQVACSECASCTPNCISDLPYQCTNYLVLNEADRSVSNGGCGRYDGKGCYHDYRTANNRSPGWQGQNYYRFMSPAGSMLLETKPLYYHCGTSGSGWLDGQHPEEIGVETEMIVCLSPGWNDNEDDCIINSTITVTNCDGHFVYMLPETPEAGARRYCGNGIQQG